MPNSATSGGSPSRKTTGRLRTMTRSGIFGGSFHARELRGFVRKHARKKSAGRKMLRRRRAIIGNRSAQFKPAGQFLRMLAFHAGVRRKIRRAAGDEIKFFIGAENFRFPKIAFADFVAVCQVRCSARIFWQARRFRFAPRSVTNFAPGRRHAQIMPTVPMPLPRSSAVRAVGHQLVPYHAVKMSSVEKRWPSRS